MGRKPINETAKNSGLLVRLSESERAHLDAAAELLGVPTSTWIRDVAMNAATQILTPKKKRTSN